jgi:hypothetical protein
MRKRRFFCSPTKTPHARVNYLVFVKLASIRIWLRADESTPWLVANPPYATKSSYPRRGIQYAAASRLNAGASGILGHRPSRVTTDIYRAIIVVPGLVPGIHDVAVSPENVDGRGRARP